MAVYQFQISEQMFLWLISPAPAKYGGGGGGRIFNSPAFYDVSPPDASGTRAYIRTYRGQSGISMCALRSWDQIGYRSSRTSAERYSSSELNGHPFRRHCLELRQHALLEVHLFGGEAGGVWVVGDEHDCFAQLVIQG